jgi:hypothetical protein
MFATGIECSYPILKGGRSRELFKRICQLQASNSFLLRRAGTVADDNPLS